jgi:hypothetical protein
LTSSIQSVDSTSRGRSPRTLAVWALAFLLACGDAQSQTRRDAGPRGDSGQDATLPVVDSARPTEVPRNETPLLDHGAWRRYDAALDPLESEQPAELECGIAGFFVERDELEIDSSRCNYLLAEHPALLDLPSGREVHMELRHFDLSAPEPAQVHIAILFGDDLQWETELPIPSPANVLDVRFQTTRALVKNEPIRVHLHNHGQNTYTLAFMRAVAQ